MDKNIHQQLLNTKLWPLPQKVPAMQTARSWEGVPGEIRLPCTYMIGYLAQPVSETQQQARRMLNLTQNIHSYILFVCHLPNPKEPCQSPVSLPCPPSLQNAYTKPNKALLYKSRSWLQSHLLMAAKIIVFWNLLVLEDILQAVWKSTSGHIRTTRASSSNVQVQEQKLQFDTYDPPLHCVLLKSWPRFGSSKTTEYNEVTTQGQSTQENYSNRLLYLESGFLLKDKATVLMCSYYCV